MAKDVENIIDSILYIVFSISESVAKISKNMAKNGENTIDSVL